MIGGSLASPDFSRMSELPGQFFFIVAAAAASCGRKSVSQFSSVRRPHAGPRAARAFTTLLSPALARVIAASAGRSADYRNADPIFVSTTSNSFWTLSNIPIISLASGSDFLPLNGFLDFSFFAMYFLKSPSE